jgi:hypothetical protein
MFGLALLSAEGFMKRFMDRFMEGSFCGHRRRARRRSGKLRKERIGAGWQGHKFECPITVIM